MKHIRKPSAGRTKIVLDSKLVQRVKRLANVKTTRDAVHGHRTERARYLRRRTTTAS